MDADHSKIVEAVIRVLPGWRFVTRPEPFTWPPHMHLRARLVKGSQTRSVVIRRSWRPEAYQTETFLYRKVLPNLSIRTSEFLGTFMLEEDSSQWMLLEDLGTVTARNDRVEDRKAMLRALGCLHGQGTRLVAADELSDGPLWRFDGQHIPFGPKIVPFGNWRNLLQKALQSSYYALEPWAPSFADALFAQLSTQPLTLLHGDPALDNAVWIDQEVGLVDFERAYIGPPSLDIGRVAEYVESYDELQDYHTSFSELANTHVSMEAVHKWSDLGEALNCIRWMCYYIAGTTQDKAFSTESRRNLYDRLRQRLCQLYRQ